MDVYVKQFQEKGYAVIPDFLTDNDVNLLKKSCAQIVEEMSPAEHCEVYVTGEKQSSSNYFMTSGDKIRYFFEDGVLSDKGELTVKKEVSLNKIGHALHYLHPDFRNVTFSEKVKELLKSIQAVDPVVVQSMYIFKNAGRGGEVVPHQDASFVHTQPEKVIGLWFPLEDATEENGCLWFIPGSHKGPLYAQWIRKGQTMAYKSDVIQPVCRDEEFIPAPARQGSCVLIHDKVVHRSSKNTSQHPRPAYTFHIWDRHQSEYDSNNWIQPTEFLPFTSVYKNQI